MTDDTERTSDRTEFNPAKFADHVERSGFYRVISTLMERFGWSRLESIAYLQLNELARLTNSLPQQKEVLALVRENMEIMRAEIRDHRESEDWKDPDKDADST